MAILQTVSGLCYIICVGRCSMHQRGDLQSAFGTLVELICAGHRVLGETPVAITSEHILVLRD